jgi:hypothetical protein
VAEKDNVVELVGGAELALVINALAATGSITTTKRRFKAFYGREISAKHIQLVQHKYADKIKKRREELNDKEALKDCPGLTRRARVELLLEIIDAALEPRVVGTYTKLNENTGEKETLPIIRQDLNSALLALGKLKDEQFDWDKLELQKKKAGEGEILEDYEVDDGVA